MTTDPAIDQPGRIGGLAKPVWEWSRELYWLGKGPLADTFVAWAVEQGLPINDITIDVPPDIIAGTDGFPLVPRTPRAPSPRAAHARPH